MRARPVTAGLLLLLASLPAGPPPAGADEKPIERAEALLGDGDWRERIRALEILEGLAGEPRAERAALRALADPDWGVVLRAAGTLGKIGGRESRDPLVRLSVEGEIQWIRDAAVGALAAVDREGAASSLLKLARGLRDPAPRARALRAIGGVGAAGDVKGVAAFLSNKEIEVVAAAAAALGRIGEREPKARDEVLRMLEAVLAMRAERKQFFAYAAAVEGLGLIPSRRTTTLLVEELFQVADDDGYIPERVARGLGNGEREALDETVRTALGRAKEPAVLRRLCRLCARLRLRAARPDLAGLLGHREERVRTEAVRALGELGEPDGAGAAESALDDKSPLVRREGVTALARLAGPERLRALAARILKDPDEEVRLQWVVELNDAGEPASLPVLAEAFADGSWRVASAALAAAGTLGISSDLPRFLPSAAHRDWRVRAAAFEAMGRLRAAEAIPLLADGLRDRDPVVKGVCHANLRILARTDLPPDPAPWQSWWAKNGDGLVLVKRSRRSAEEIEKERKAREEAVSVVRERRGIEVLQKARILVVQGAWDHVERVLEHLEIPHTLLRSQQIKGAGLNPNQVVLINCEGNVDRDGAERLQWFVNAGGYLMSTDWALTKAVQRCFPGFVGQYTGSNTGNDVVVVEEALPGHPFTAGIFGGVPAMKWWLEIQAFPIRVEYPERCAVIVDSAEMKQRYGSSPMATVFRWGLGKVQHSLSHFYLQEEGMTQARGERARMVFAADHLGLSVDAIRILAGEGRFSGQLDEETMRKIAPDYSMFRLIVNVVSEKERWVEDL